MTVNKNSHSDGLRKLDSIKFNNIVITPGSRVRFERGDGVIASDTVRHIFWQETPATTGLPNGKPEKGHALILTQHSWCWVKDVVEIQP